jgi:hypothetical protein
VAAGDVVAAGGQFRGVARSRAAFQFASLTTGNSREQLSFIDEWSTEEGAQHRGRAERINKAWLRYGSEFKD